MRSRVRWWIGLALLGAALAGVLAWLGQERAGDVAGPSNAAVEDPGAAGVEPVVPRSARREHAPAPGIPTPEGRAFAGPEHARPGAALVRVVRRADGAPVAGASVWVQREDGDRAAWSRAWLALGDIGAVLQSGLGQKHLADERGRVELPLPESGLWVFATRDGLRGEGRVEREAPEALVELVPARSVEVLTVDRSGAPLAGVHVDIVRRVTQDWSQIAFAISGADGRCELFVDADVPDELDPPPILAPMLVAAEPEGVDVQPGRLPAEPVRFVIGPHGRVVVRTVDARGELREVRGRSSLSVEVQRNLELPPALAAGAWLERLLERGETVFERVGVGLALRVVVEPEGWNVAVVEGEGPAAPGLERTIEVELLRRRLILRGRVLGQDGDPLGPARLSGRLHDGVEPGAQVMGVWTDEQGRFEDRGGRGFERVEAGAAIELIGSRDGEVAARAVVPLPLPDDDGVVDLGEVLLRPIGLIASGSVELEGGEPVANAQVFVAGTNLSARSGRDGRFALSGDAPAAAFELVARDWEYLSGDPVAAAAGAEGVRILMRRGARLAGRLLLPAGGDFEVLRLIVEVERPGAGAEPAWRYEGFDLGPEGGFELRPLEPGRGRLGVRIGELDLPLADGLELVEGETTRLGPIDLRAQLASLRLLVVDERGAALSDGRVFLLGGGGERLLALPLRIDGTVGVVSIAARVDVEVAVDGLPPARFAGVGHGDRLVVPDGVRVTLAVAPGPGLPAGAQVRVRAVGDGGTLELTATLTAEGRAELLLPGPGAWTLAWSLRRTDGSEVALLAAAPRAVEIPVETREVRLEASLDPEELAHALSGG